jgi:hypothetical protein
VIWLIQLNAEANNPRKKRRRTMRTAPDLTAAITATDRASLDRQLDEAVDAAITRAIREGRPGILVTRHAHDSFTVALSDDVPFGQTLEHQD